MDIYDDFKNALSFLLAVICVAFFYFIFVMKLNVMAKQAEVKMQDVYVELKWGDYLNQRAAMASEKRESIGLNKKISKSEVDYER